jgi:hypothetical protein
VEEKKTLAKLASKFRKLFANSKFHPHSASGRVVIRTPENDHDGWKKN